MHGIGNQRVDCEILGFQSRPAECDQRQFQVGRELGTWWFIGVRGRAPQEPQKSACSRRNKKRGTLIKSAPLQICSLICNATTILSSRFVAALEIPPSAQAIGRFSVFRYVEAFFFLMLGDRESDRLVNDQAQHDGHHKSVDASGKDSG